MSLITDLLSKIKQQEPERGVPPLLKHSVQHAAAGRRSKRRLAIPLVVVLAVVVMAVAAMFVEDYFSRPIRPFTPHGSLTSQTATLPVIAVQAAATATVAPPALSPPAVSQPQSPAMNTHRSKIAVKESLPHIEKEDLGKAKVTSGAPVKTPAWKTAGKTVQVSARDRERILQAPGKGAQYETKNFLAGKSRPVGRELHMNALKKDKESSFSGLEQGEKPEKVSKQDKDVYLYAARTYESRKDYRQALSNYKMALAIDPADYRVMNNIANALIQSGAYEEAIRYAEKALQTRGNYIHSLINMGIAYSQLGKFKEGEVYLQRALSMEKSNRNALLNLGLLYEKSKDYHQARAIFTRLSDTGDAQGYLGMARISEKQGKTLDAVDFYRAVMSLEKPESPLWTFANDRIWQLTR